MTAIPKETWTVATAKARFSELIDKAKSEGPQTVTRNGKPAARLVPIGKAPGAGKRLGLLKGRFPPMSLEAFNAALKDAGVEQIIAEMQSQIDAWLATK